MKTRVAVLSVLLGLTIVFVYGLRSRAAGPPGPGKYCGVVVFDRWDACSLCAGLRVLYVSEHAKEALRNHVGEAVQVDATSIRGNQREGLIQELTYLGPAPDGNMSYAAGLQLRAAMASSDGTPPELCLQLTNSGNVPITIDHTDLGPALFAKTNGALYTLADGPSFALITRHYLSSVLSSTGTGTGINAGIAYSYSGSRGSALPENIVLAPGTGKNFYIKFALPPGEYDLLFAYGGLVNMYKAFASNLVAFDVDKDGNAKAVKVNGR